MGVIWSERVDLVLRSGVSLECIGVKNWALGRNESLQAICDLEYLGVPILGGDVYELINGAAEHNYASWHCGQREGEPDIDFLQRSLDEEKSYVARYLIDSALFAVVPKI